MRIKEKKINKIAQVKLIDNLSTKKNIFIISKIIEYTSVSQYQYSQNSFEKSVRENKIPTIKPTKFKKQKNTRIQSSQLSAQSSEFFPERPEVKVSETKNISTSYGKMILRFMQINKQKINKVLEQNGMDFNDFQKTLIDFTHHMFSVSDLRKLWQEQSNKYSKIMRIFSMNFLRKHSLQYIFNSRIKMYDRNLKYKHKIIEGVKSPERFNMLKDF